MRLVAVCALIALPPSADAEDSEYYARLSAGFGRPIALSTVAEPGGDVPPVALDIDFGTAITGAAAIGRGLGGSFRTELEYRYLRSGLDQLVLLDADDDAPEPAIPDADRAVAHILLAGFTYDIERTETFRLYAGGALGAANVNGVGDLAAGAAFEDADWNLAFQARAGVGFKITPRLSLGADYAFVGTTGATFAPAPGLASLEVDGLRVSTFNFFVERSF